MNNFILYISLIVICLVNPVEAEDALKILPGPIPARIVRVVDGDTLAVRAQIWVQQQVDVLVRIRGVDAPELKGKCAKETQMAEAAKARLEQMIQGHEMVFLEQISPDKYGGRVVAIVRLLPDKTPFADVGSLLLQEGVVRRYDGRARPGWCP